MITNGSAQVISNNLYDVFGVLRYQQGSAETPWRQKGWRVDDESTLRLLSYMGISSNIYPDRGLSTNNLVPQSRGLYGNWCGPFYPPHHQRKPKPGGGYFPDPPPIDDLDRCCFIHDDCMDRQCRVLKTIGGCILCQCDLLFCIMSVDCGRTKSPIACIAFKVGAVAILNTKPGKICFMIKLADILFGL